MARRRFHLSLFLLIVVSSPNLSAAADILLNGFNTSDLALYGHATVEAAAAAAAASTAGHSYLSLTNTSSFSIGRALYKSKVANSSTAFHASFIFSMAPIPGSNPGHGIAFLFSPSPGLQDATSAQHLGLFSRYSDGNKTNGVLAIEFDVFRNEEFSDIDDNHVGVDLFSLTSVVSHTAGYWPDDPSSSSFRKLKLNDGTNYQAWIDYADRQLNVTMAPAGSKKPRRPLISTQLDLTEVFLDEMYVGFCAATGVLVQRHMILSWSFSNHNSSLSDALMTSNLPSFVPPADGRGMRKGAVAGISAAAVLILLLGSALLIIVRRQRNQKKIDAEESGKKGEEAVEKWEMEYWPHRIPYREISAATDNFSERNFIGCGGNGKVYKGTMAGAEVAVKVFGRNSSEEARQFAAEVSSLGRMKHRNLVGLRGWCRRTRKEGGGMILVYDYMQNGSLDRWIFPDERRKTAPEKKPMSWETRLMILKDVAEGLLYLHDGWEVRVLHRDIKASNVMLDGSMNGRLGDFGLARTHERDSGLGTSRVVGSVGYMAPEVVRSGKFSVATDVYGFGVLVMEVVCGRRPVEEGLPPLVDWVWGLSERGELSKAADASLEANNKPEVLWLLEIGLSCTCPEPAARPSMAQVVRGLEEPFIAQWEDGGKEEKAETALLDRKLRAAGAMAPTTVILARPGAVKRHPQPHHLTFEELRQSVSGSSSLSASDIIEGR